MKRIVYFSILIFLSCTNTGLKKQNDDLIIDTTWKKKIISKVVSLSLPDSSIFFKNSSLNASFGKGKFGLYGVDYFDTVVVLVENERDFHDALKGYLTGKCSDPSLNSYNFKIIDTNIGNSTGYFLKGYSYDSIVPCQYTYCYLTLANNNFYWFYTCQSTSIMTNETKQFFNSIEFDKKNIAESEYRLPKTLIHREAK